MKAHTHASRSWTFSQAVDSCTNWTIAKYFDRSTLLLAGISLEVEFAMYFNLYVFKFIACFTIACHQIVTGYYTFEAPPFQLLCIPCGSTRFIWDPFHISGVDICFVGHLSQGWANRNLWQAARSPVLRTSKFEGPTKNFIANHFY